MTPHSDSQPGSLPQSDCWEGRGLGRGKRGGCLGPEVQSKGGLGPLCLSGGGAQVCGAEAGAHWECRGAKGGSCTENEIRVLRRGCPQHHGATAAPLSARSWQPVGATHSSLVPAPGMDMSGISRRDPVGWRKCQGGMGGGVRVVTVHRVSREDHSEQVTFRPGRGSGHTGTWEGGTPGRGDRAAGPLPDCVPGTR